MLLKTGKKPCTHSVISWTDPAIKGNPYCIDAAQAQALV
jgi:hypothetical protein